jgi:hypothetical protein
MNRNHAKLSYCYLSVKTFQIQKCYIRMYVCIYMYINNTKRSIVAAGVIVGIAYSWHNTTVSGHSTLCQIHHNFGLYVYCPIFFTIVRKKNYYISKSFF